MRTGEMPNHGHKIGPFGQVMEGLILFWICVGVIIKVFT